MTSLHMTGVDGIIASTGLIFVNKADITKETVIIIFLLLLSRCLISKIVESVIAINSITELLFFISLYPNVLGSFK